MLSMSRVARVAAYAWAGPTTLLGIAISLASFALPRRRGEVLLCRSGRGFARWFLTRRGYSAITLGHVIVLTPEAPADILLHEMVHVRQTERWGVFFIPVYLLAMVAQWLRGRHPYWDNPFEKEARERSEP